MLSRDLGILKSVHDDYYSIFFSLPRGYVRAVGNPGFEAWKLKLQAGQGSFYE